MSVKATDAEVRRRFDIDGYVAIPEFLIGDELINLIANVDRFIRDVVPTMPLEQVFYEDKTDTTTLKQIQKMGEHDAWFHQLFTHGRFRELAEFLMDGPVVPKNVQYFNKPPVVSQPTPAHQDGFYFMIAPCDALTMWFALDDVDPENGCVRYIPGSHLKGMREHLRTQVLGFSQGIVGYPTVEDQRNEVAVPAKPGDLLVHHAMTTHRADENRSANRSRRSLGFIYYSERACEDVVAKAVYQRELTERMKASGRI